MVPCASMDVSGIDVAFNWRFSLKDAIGIPGRFDLRYDGTRPDAVVQPVSTQDVAALVRKHFPHWEAKDVSKLFG